LGLPKIREESEEVVRSEEIAELVAALPQGMDADEFIVKLVNWALDIERKACAAILEADAKARGLTDTAAVLLKNAERIRARGDE